MNKNDTSLIVLYQRFGIMITIIIHNSMEVVQYIIYIINDDIKNTMDYY
jgi:hypothetical protein